MAYGGAVIDAEAPGAREKTTMKDDLDSLRRQIAELGEQLEASRRANTQATESARVFAAVLAGLPSS